MCARGCVCVRACVHAHECVVFCRRVNVCTHVCMRRSMRACVFFLPPIAGLGVGPTMTFASTSLGRLLPSHRPLLPHTSSHIVQSSPFRPCSLPLPLQLTQGRIHVNLNKSGVNLASRVTIFNTVVFVLTNQNDISGVTGLYAPPRTYFLL